MALVSWKEEYKVHNEVDEQHKGFFAAINKLDTVAPSDRAALGAVLDELVDYATYHFSAEERIMQQHGYPDFAAHCDRHRKFIAKVVLYKTDFNKGKDIDPNEVMDWAGSWLIHHILQRDQQIVPFLKGRKK